MRNVSARRRTNPARQGLPVTLMGSPVRSIIGRLHLREDAAWLAELLIDIEVDEVVRLQITDALRLTLGPR